MAGVKGGPTETDAGGRGAVAASTDGARANAAPTLEYARFTREAPYKRADPDAPNEDASLCLELDAETTVLAVADGVGGQAHGEQASALAIECLREGLERADADPANLREPILDAIERCNRELLADGRGSATTIAVVERYGDTMRPYHVGDSSILVVGGRGRVRFRSINHSPIGYGIEAGLLDESAATEHEERHWLSNIVGSDEMRIEIGAPLALAARDTLLLCSDALTDNLTLEAISDAARRRPLARAVELLESACEAAMGGANGHPDDLTLVLHRRLARGVRRAGGSGRARSSSGDD